MTEPLSVEDAALVERLARRVVDLRMAAPAIFMLESLKPMNFVASQAMAFFQPLVAAFFDTTTWQRLSTLLERRDALEHLLLRIEALDE